MGQQRKLIGRRYGHFCPRLSLPGENEETRKADLQRDVEDEESCVAGKDRHLDPNPRFTIPEL